MLSEIWIDGAPIGQPIWRNVETALLEDSTLLLPVFWIWEKPPRPLCYSILGTDGFKLLIMSADYWAGSIIFKIPPSILLCGIY